MGSWELTRAYSQCPTYARRDEEQFLGYFREEQRRGHGHDQLEEADYDGAAGGVEIHTRLVQKYGGVETDDVVAREPAVRKCGNG